MFLAALTCSLSCAIGCSSPTEIMDPIIQRARVDTAWRSPVGGEVVAALRVSGDIGYAVSTSGQITSFAMSDGTVRWWHDQAEPLFTDPVVLADRLIVSSDSGVLALRADGGGVDWSSSAPEVVGSPYLATYGDDLLLTGDDRGMVIGHGLDDGPPDWVRHLIGTRIGPVAVNRSSAWFGMGVEVARRSLHSAAHLKTLHVGTAVDSRPCIGNDIMLALAEDGTMLAIEATLSKVIWSAEGVSSCAAWQDVGVLATTSGQLSARHMDTGGVLWSVELDEPLSPVEIVSGMALVGTDSGSALVFDLETGDVLVSATLPGSVVAAAIASETYAVFAANDGAVHSIPIPRLPPADEAAPG